MNKIEKLKLELTPKLFERELEGLDWRNLTERERFFLKSFGIYHIKLRADYFMIRVRFDGLDIPTSQLLTTAEIARNFNLETLITARGGLELHNIAPEDVYEIYQQLQRAKINTKQSLTDNFRAITTDPFFDFEKEMEFELKPIIDSILDFFLDNEQFMGLIPRKFNTAFVATKEPITNFWGNDALFALAKRGDEVGFNLYLGGKNSEVAKSSNIFITPNQTRELFIALAKTFKERGLRGSRSKTRLFHLIETVGVKRVRGWIEESFGQELQSEGELLLKEPKDKSFVELRDGYFGYKIPSNYGEISVDKLAKIAQNQGQTIRFGSDQNIYIITKDAPSFQRERALDIVACVGSRYCRLSLWDIKRDVDYLPVERLKELGVKVGFSGCLKGCGRHYHSDIGLIGLRTNLYAPTERAFRFFLGATYDQNPTPARMLYYSVPKRSTNLLIENILDDFEASGEATFVSFSQNILSKFQIETLQIWFLVKELYPLKDARDELFATNEQRLLEKISQTLKVEITQESITEIIKEISHRVWDLKK